ncbi:MAG: hypothetical protein WDN45_00750 [Caulobacteraceae bacterium]
MRRLAAVAVALAVLGSPVFAQERPTADVYIRSQAGLPPSSARGEIQVIDLGARSLDAMLSIVGHRTVDGWRVSYVCAQSAACDPKRFILAREFALSADAARRLDAALERLRGQPEAESPPQPATACRRIAVSIDDRGFKRGYRRACEPSADLAELETLLKAGLP